MRGSGLKFSLIILGILVLSGCDQSPEPVPIDLTRDPLEATLEKIQTILDEGEYPGLSVAVAVNGEMVLANGFGVKNIETGEKPDHETMFRVYSVSKPLTGIMTAKLAGDGQLNLDAPISNYLPGLPEKLKTITSRQLAGHIGGIRHYQDNEWMKIAQDACPVPADGFAPFINNSLIADPGQEYSYSSFGYVLLSGVLEAASGQNFEPLFNDLMFAPSGAERFDLDDPTTTRPKNMATFYDTGGLFGPSVSDPINNGCKFGAGGWNASAEALTKVFMNFLDGDLTSPETLEMTFQQITPATPNEAKMGMGFGSNISSDGYRYASMSGSGLGGRAAMVIFPDEKIVVVILGNTEGRSLFLDAYEIAKAFALGKE